MSSRLKSSSTILISLKSVDSFEWIREKDLSKGPSKVDGRRVQRVLKKAHTLALRYTHATDEAKRRAVENLVRKKGPSDESVTKEKGRVAALP